MRMAWVMAVWAWDAGVVEGRIEGGVVAMGMANGKGKEGKGGVDSDDDEDKMSSPSSLSTPPPPSLTMRGVWGWVMVAWTWDASHAHAPLLSSHAGVGGQRRQGQGWLACRLRPPNPTHEEGRMGVGHVHPHTCPPHPIWGRGQCGGMGVGVGHMDVPHPHDARSGWGASTPTPPHCPRPMWDEGGVWAWGWTCPTQTERHRGGAHGCAPPPCRLGVL